MSHHPQVLAYAFGREQLHMLNSQAAANMVMAHHHGANVVQHQPANLVSHYSSHCNCSNGRFESFRDMFH